MNDIWEKIEREVIRRTVAESNYRCAALDLFMAHRARRYAPEWVSFRCRQCRNNREGVRWTLPSGGICDSWGFIEDHKGQRTCHICLGDGYIGDIFAPQGEPKWRKKN